MGLLETVGGSMFDDRVKKLQREIDVKNGKKTPEPSLIGAIKDPQFREDVKRGLLDSLNRGAVASTLGGPVDLATMVMRLGGYNVEKPIGGSEWVGDKMQQMGLIGETRNPIAEAIASVAVPGAMTKAGQGLFKAEQAAIQNANIAGPLSGGKFATQRGVFGGINAKTADKAKLSQAEQMLNKGVDPAQVWKETGWGRGPDGKWRFEISDHNATLAGFDPTDYVARAAREGGIDAARAARSEIAGYTQPYRRTSGVQNIDDVFQHQELYDAYPELRQITYRASDSPVIGEGSYSPKFNRIELTPNNQEGARSVFAHELNHPIQSIEGHSVGGSPEALAQAYGEARSRLHFLEQEPEFKKANAALDSIWDDVFTTGKLSESDALKREADLIKQYPTLAEQRRLMDVLKSSSEDGYDAYKRLGGEAEARLTQARLNLTPEERRAQFPFEPEYYKQQTGVGLDDLIHRFDGGEAKSVGFTYPQDAALETARQNGVKMLGLPENNTPMDRAKALGFDTDAFHATNVDVPKFDVDKSSSAAAFGKGVYTADDPLKVSGWAKSADGSNVMPLMVNKSNVLPMAELNTANSEKLSEFLGRKVSQGSPVPYFSLEKRGGSVSDGAKLAGFSGVDHSGPGGLGLNTVFSDPSVIRSRFAAFDPARVNENDLLAGAMPFGLLLDPENRAKLGF